MTGMPATEDLVDPATHDAIMAAAERIAAVTSVRDARDPVNQPTINNWLEAMGVENPRFTAGEAPPTMAQVWTMYGLGGKPAVTLYFDAATGLLVKSEMKVKDEFQNWKEVTDEVFFSDYKDEGGRKVYTKIRVVRDGKPTGARPGQILRRERK